MKKFLIIAFFALFSVNANSADTPAVNSTKIAIIDIDKIVQDSKAMRYIQKKVSQKQESYQKQVNKKQKALEKEQKRIEAKKSVLSSEALAKESTEFQKKLDDLRDFVDRRQNSLKKASLAGMSKVNDAIKDIIADIAKEKNIDLIIPSSQALYHKQNLDISADVLKRLNKKITKVKVRFN